MIQLNTEASNWNKELDTEIIVIDEVQAEITNFYALKRINWQYCRTIQPYLKMCMNLLLIKIV